MEIYRKLATPPENALKKIIGGRMNGKSDINPQWRIEMLTEVFGLCGIGWYDEVVKTWTMNVNDNQIMCFAEVHLFVKVDGEWSKPIVGTGGNMLVTLESKGLFASDEGYKMAITDAFSVCCKKIGVAADIYRGIYDSKYSKPSAPAQVTAALKPSAPAQAPKPAAAVTVAEAITAAKNCKDQKALTAVWAKYAAFQTDAEFTKVVATINKGFIEAAKPVDPIAEDQRQINKAVATIKLVQSIEELEAVKANYSNLIRFSEFLHACENRKAELTNNKK